MGTASLIALLQDSSSGVGEPVVDLSQRKASLIRQVGLFLLRRIRVVIVVEEPRLQGLGSRVWQVAATLFVVVEHALLWRVTGWGCRELHIAVLGVDFDAFGTRNHLVFFKLKVVRFVGNGGFVFVT